jgi:hypothetical protein
MGEREEEGQPREVGKGSARRHAPESAVDFLGGGSHHIHTHAQMGALRNWTVSDAPPAPHSCNTHIRVGSPLLVASLPFASQRASLASAPAEYRQTTIWSRKSE